MQDDNNKKTDAPGILLMTRRALKCVMSVAWKEKKIVFLLYFIRLIGAILGEFKLLLLPKLLVDEVVAISEGAELSVHLNNAILYIALTIGTEFLSQVLQNIANSTLNYESVCLDRILTYGLSEKSMEMDFQYTEDPDQSSGWNILVQRRSDRDFGMPL